MQLLRPYNLDWLSSLDIPHLHEIAVVVLSEFIINIKLKSKLMKAILHSIFIHLTVSSILTTLGCLITHGGKQTIPFGRFCKSERIQMC